MKERYDMDSLEWKVMNLYYAYIKAPIYIALEKLGIELLYRKKTKYGKPPHLYVRAPAKESKGES